MPALSGAAARAGSAGPQTANTNARPLGTLCRNTLLPPGAIVAQRH
jgi:hypothetical protein